MDRVRLGRALGFGARQAMKTLLSAVDAAMAENPAAKTASTAPGGGTQHGRQSGGQVATSTQPEVPTARTPPTTSARKAAQATARTVVQAREVRQGLRRGTKRFGEAVWGPLVRLSGVLWLEVAGVFFGIFALFALTAVWRLHGQWHASASARWQFLGAVTMLVVFGYFCVSSYVRAYRRERRR